MEFAALPRRRARGRPAEGGRSSRARIAFWISSHRGTWDGDAGLSVVDRRFGARCLPPYFSRFRRCRKRLVVSISNGLDLQFLPNRREPTPHFRIEDERLNQPRTIVPQSFSVKRQLWGVPKQVGADKERESRTLGDRKSTRLN